MKTHLVVLTLLVLGTACTSPTKRARSEEYLRQRAVESQKQEAESAARAARNKELAEKIILNWPRLKAGMSHAEVNELIGPVEGLELSKLAGEFGNSAFQIGLRIESILSYKLEFTNGKLSKWELNK